MAKAVIVANRFRQKLGVLLLLPECKRVLNDARKLQARQSRRQRINGQKAAVFTVLLHKRIRHLKHTAVFRNFAVKQIRLALLQTFGEKAAVENDQMHGIITVSQNRTVDRQPLADHCADRRGAHNGAHTRRLSGHKITNGLAVCKIKIGARVKTHGILYRLDAELCEQLSAFFAHAFDVLDVDAITAPLNNSELCAIANCAWNQYPPPVTSNGAFSFSRVRITA